MEKNMNTLLENKYISLIEKYMCKDEHIIILNSVDIMNTNNINNKIFLFLKQNNYKYSFYNQYNVLGPEINNIIKINIGKKCNNIFIGYFNMQKLTGSNLTYTLINHMNDNVKHVLLDINNISLPEETNFL